MTTQICAPAGPADGDEDVLRILAEIRSQILLLVNKISCDLLRLAQLVGEYEARGGDVKELRLSRVQTLRRISCGIILPELVTRYQDCPTLFRAASRLPHKDQQRFIDGTVELLQPDGSMRRRDPTLLHPDEIRQLIAGDHIRDQAEQIVYVQRLRKPKDDFEVAADEALTTEKLVLTVAQKKALRKKAKQAGCDTPSEYVLRTLGLG